MGIGNITSTNSTSAMQMTAPNLKDQKSKSIQSEITDAQQQMRKLSSKEDLSANEKTNERKKLQKEISSLNTELKLHQEELRKSQKREFLMAQPQEEKKPVQEVQEDKPEDNIQLKEASPDTEGKNGLPADNQQAAQRGTIITQNSNGTVILKGNTNQNENLGIDTENEQDNASKEGAIDAKETKNSKNDIAENANLSSKEIHAMTAADSSFQQASSLGTIIARTSGGIAILKGEINQDENLGADTERKQAELEKLEKKEQRAMAFQFSILGEANNAAKSAAETDTSAKDSAQANGANSISALNMPQEDQVLQPNFYVSIA